MRNLFILLLAAAALSAAAQVSPKADEAALASERAAPVAPSLSELVGLAWTRQRGAAVRDALGAELDARAAAVRAPFPQPPSIGFDLRRDLPPAVRLPGADTVDVRGRNEIEPSVAIPLWLPGQREGQLRLIDRERARLDAAVRLERLSLAGEVREAAWGALLARGELALQQGRLGAAHALEADVARRVSAGELAPVDRLLARTDTLAAEAAVREAQARDAHAKAELRRLAGVEDVGEITEVPADGEPNDAHPLLAGLREATATARARLELAQALRRDNPTLSASARFDRDAYGAGYRNTVRLGISLPLDTEARNVPRIAAASVALTEAEIAQTRRARALATEVDRARIALASARETLSLNAARAEVARDASAAIERAFRAGERGLPEWLRTRALAFDAERARELARLQVGLAVARLNQILGVQP